MDATQHIGKVIKDLRTKKQFSLSEVARCANVSKGNLSKIENGLGQNATLAVLVRIGVALNTSASKLVKMAEDAALKSTPNA